MVTFTPCFLWTVLGAPFTERLRDNRLLSAALTSIAAAVVGVILNLAVWLGLNVLFAQLRPLATLGIEMALPVWRTLDLMAALLVVAALVTVFRFKVETVAVLTGCAIGGLLLAPAWNGVQELRGSSFRCTAQ